MMILLQYWDVIVVPKSLQYELVAELFDENMGDPSATKVAKRPTVLRSSSKDLPGRAAQQKQMRKTVGSQVLLWSYNVSNWWTNLSNDNNSQIIIYK